MNKKTKKLREQFEMLKTEVENLKKINKDLIKFNSGGNPPTK